MYLDIIWVIPALIFVGWTWLVYRLGIEVGRVFQEREERARRRHPSNRVRSNTTSYQSNVIRLIRK